MDRSTILVVGNAGHGIKFITDTILPIFFTHMGHEVSSGVLYSSAQRKGSVIGDIVVGGGGEHHYVDYILALDQEALYDISDRINENTVIMYNSKINIQNLPNHKTSIPINIDDLNENLYENTTAAGAFAHFLGLTQKDELIELLKNKNMGKKNLESILTGFDLVNFPYTTLLYFGEKSNRFHDEYYLSGNEAAVYGAIRANANMFFGYPITPSSETMEEWSKICNKFNGVFKQSLSEEIAIGLVLGANAAGAKAWTATSGPGLTRMLEQINYGAAARIPFVIYNVQRGGPSTGLATLTQQSDLFTAAHGAHGDYPSIVLTPSDSQDSYDLITLAFKLARRYNFGIIVNSSKEVAQRRNHVKINLDDFCYYDFSLENKIRGHKTGSASDENGYPKIDPLTAKKWLDNLHEKFEKDYDALSMAIFDNMLYSNLCTPLNYLKLPYDDFSKKGFRHSKIFSANNTLVIGYGETIPAIKEIVSENKKLSFIGLKSVYPYPIRIIKRLNSIGVKKIYCVEQNRNVKVYSEEGQLAQKLKCYFKNETVPITQYDGRPVYADKLKEKLENA